MGTGDEGNTRLTLDDVLDLKYLGKWDWSPCGRWIAWVHDAGGVADLWLGEPDGGTVSKLTAAKEGVADFAWRPGPHPGLALVIDGDLYLAGQEGAVKGAGGKEATAQGTAANDARQVVAGAAGSFTVRRLVSRKDPHRSPAWSPDGRTLAYCCGEAAILYWIDAGEHRELKLPGKVAPPSAARSLAWSPDGTLLACQTTDKDNVPQVVVVSGCGEQVWSTLEEDPAGGAAWVDEATLLYRVARNSGGDVDFFLATFDLAAEARSARAHRKLICHAPGDGRGPALHGAAVPSPDGAHIVLLLENDGYAHYYLYARDTGELEQVTFGRCEDFGHAGDEPVWTPDGLRVVFSSNRDGHGYRHLWALDVATGDLVQLTHGRVTDVQPRVSHGGKKLAFVHCDEYRNMDIWVGPLADPGVARQLSRSMPSSWTRENQVVPEEITYRGAGGWTIHAQLYRPHCWRPGDDTRYPALVWVHGGPIRQLRPTWHPMRSYALFHAYHQYLLHRGYVVLTVNYRGGIGYGREFRHGLYRRMGVDDVLDVACGGRFLKTVPYVDPERVAVWGLSYGGYMTLHCLTQYPEEFAMGVNVAGIWDIAQWDRWVESRGRKPTWSRWYLGGSPEESPELYRQASPCSFKEQLSRPLINVQGTKDANVDFAQLDRIVQDCVRLGKEYEAYYYPAEVHTFRHRHSWRDAFPKIERDLERYLRPNRP